MPPSEHHATISEGASLRLALESDPWDSVIAFDEGIPVVLEGSLELTFADDVHLATQVGRTFRLFDWDGVTPQGTLDISSPYRWDTGALYTTGEITLRAVPEPSVQVAWALAVLALCAPARHPQTRRRPF